MAVSLKRISMESADWPIRFRWRAAKTPRAPIIPNIAPLNLIIFNLKVIKRI